MQHHLCLPERKRTRGTSRAGVPDSQVAQCCRFSNTCRETCSFYFRISRLALDKKALARRAPDGKLLRELLEEPEDDWDGEKGFIDEDLLRRRLPDVDYVRDYMICGPPPMMDAVHGALLARSVRQERIQLEKFALV